MLEVVKKYPTVSKVTKRIAAVLEPATRAGQFWVQGELSSVSQRPNGLYCDLVETRGGRPIAKLRCIIWPRWLDRIEAKLIESGAGIALRDGVEVGLSCQLSYSPMWGLSLWASDIDPEVSLGALEARRRQILSTLEREDLLRLNARLPIPTLPRRLGLVASRSTAGFADFVLTIAQCGYGIQVLAADARVQGDDTEASILKALDCLARLDVDLVVIIRGGGSKLDLSHLDNEAIARCIAKHPQAVWTGIGHETDESVLDFVAARAFKTPTAVAEAVVDRFRVAEESLRESQGRLFTAVERRTHPATRHLAESRRRLERSTHQILRERRLLARTRADRLQRTIKMRLLSQRARIDAGRRLIQTTSRIRVNTQRDGLRRVGEDLRGRSAALLTRLSKGLRSTTGRFRRERFLHAIAEQRQRHASYSALIRAADPARVVARGFALVSDEKGQLIRSVRELSVGANTTTRLADGQIHGVVMSIEETTDD